MVGRSLFFTVMLAVAGGAAVVAEAEKTAAPRVRDCRGQVALFTAKNADWTILRADAELPETGRLKTFLAGPCRIALPAAVLTMGADSDLQFDVPRRLITVERGRVYLETSDSDKWTLATEGLTVQLAAESAVELDAEQSEIVVAVTRGSAKARLAANKVEDQLAAKTQLFWQRGAETFQISPVSELNEKRKAAWTTATPAPQGLGQLLVQDAQSGTFTRLNVARYHVNVVLQPPVALVQIDQAFYNPSSRQEEGTFVFNLPPGASVSRFAMYVTPEQLMEGELIERKQAVKVYESIVSQRRDPAILEQIGDNLFKMRVFPILPQENKRILLDFTLPLESESGEYRFELPLLSDLKPITDFRVRGTIAGPVIAGSIASDSHPDWIVKPPQADGTHAKFEFARRNYEPKHSFSIRFQQPADEPVRVHSYLAEALPRDIYTPEPQLEQAPDPFDGKPANCFLAAIQPEPRRPERFPSPPVDVLILADTSAGMQSTAGLRPVVSGILHALRPTDRFRLACIDRDVRFLNNEWEVSTTEIAATALARFDREFCLGATDFVVGFESALKAFLPEDAQRRRIVIYLGDGEDTSGNLFPIDLQTRLANVLNEARSPLFPILVRNSEPGLRLLAGTARVTGGLLFETIGNREGAGDLFRWLLSGLPTPVKILAVTAAGVDAEDLLFPGAWTEGQTLTVVGRAAHLEQLQLSITTSDNGTQQTRRFALDVKPDPDDVFVGRLWAQQKLERMLGSNDVSPERIVSLAREWSLMTPLTAFLVLEKEEDYVSWKVDRAQRRLTWQPAEALPTLPRPTEVLKQFGSPVPPPKPEPPDFKRIARLMQLGRDAFEARDFELAQTVLEEVGALSEADRPTEYAALHDQVWEALARDARLRELGVHRGLVDPYATTTAPSQPPTIAPLLIGPFNAEFIEANPRGDKFLRKVAVPQTITPTLLKRLIEETTGQNVEFDTVAFGENSVDLNRTVELCAFGELPLQDFLKLALRPLQLQLFDIQNRLVLTTAATDCGIRSKRLYPVADLFMRDHVPSLEQLRDPIHDREVQVQKRFARKLQGRISVDFQNTPLKDVIRHFQSVLSEACILDAGALSDEGVSVDTSITIDAKLQDVPIAEALQTILDPLQVHYMIEGEALLVTTKAALQNDRSFRLHSALGLIPQYAPRLIDTLKQNQPPQTCSPWFPFGMGGGIGGAGGGLGGSGGGNTFAFGGAWGGGGGEAPTVPLGITVAPGEKGPTDSLEQEPISQLEVLPTQGPSVNHLGLGMRSLLTQIIETTGGPPDNPWQEVDGEGGTIELFRPTLDLFVNQTESAHAEIELLLKKLRKVPFVAGSQDGLRIAEPVSVAPEQFHTVDLGNFVRLIQNSVGGPPNGPWQELDGEGGTIIADPARLLLDIRQTTAVHDELRALLVQLRRSRYFYLTGQRPWEVDREPEGRHPWLGSPEITRWSIPEPKRAPGEVKEKEPYALKVRRVQPRGQWTLRRLTAEGQELDTISIRRDGDRLEWDQENSRIRTAGEAAAVAHPSLLIAEYGMWGAAARNALDAQFPWLPHRTNAELAQMFDVDAEPATEADKQAGIARLRFRFPGSAFLRRSYLRLSFTEADGRILAMESLVDGVLSQTFEFERRPPGDQQRVDRVRLKDASGTVLRQWDMIENGLPESPLPGVDFGWEAQHYAVLDRRTPVRRGQPALVQALDAIDLRDWPLAKRHLDAGLARQPGQPTLLLLWAWCCEQDPQLTSREDMLSALGKCAASGASGLVDFIANKHFATLQPYQSYDILVRQPPKTRTAGDCERLARVASAAGLLEEALEHLSAALRQTDSAESRFSCTVLQVEVLSKLDRSDTATLTAMSWAHLQETTIFQIEELAEVCAKARLKETSEQLLKHALSKPQLSGETRCELLHRLAAVQRDPVERGKSLLEALLVLPADSTRRLRDIENLFQEFSRPIHVEVLDEWFAKATDPELKARIRLRQAELVVDPQVAAQFCWEVFQSGLLTNSRLERGCQVFNNAQKWDWTIAASESVLRSGQKLSDSVRKLLEAAYRGVGRTAEADRAATTEP